MATLYLSAHFFRIPDFAMYCQGFHPTYTDHPTTNAGFSADAGVCPVFSPQPAPSREINKRVKMRGAKGVLLPGTIPLRRDGRTRPRSIAGISDCSAIS